MELAQAVLKKCPEVLEKKNLLLSITDDDGDTITHDDGDTISDDNGGIFKDSLKKILPGTCLVTSGTTTRVTQLVGECVCEFNENVREKDEGCKAIGIVIQDRSKNICFLEDKGVIGVDVDASVFVMDFDGKRHLVKLVQFIRWNTTLFCKYKFAGPYGGIKHMLLSFCRQVKSLTIQLKEKIQRKEPKQLKNELVRDVLTNNEEKVQFNLHKAINDQKPIRVGIDYNGDIFVKDNIGKRTTIKLDTRKYVIASSAYYLHETNNTTLAVSAIDPSFNVGDLVQIYNHSRTHTDMQDNETRIQFDRCWADVYKRPLPYNNPKALLYRQQADYCRPDQLC
ncbi:hypothetical protein DPMN_073479, partial [Dreissena polymorpha]